jgi:hypothetical protein
MFTKQKLYIMSQLCYEDEICSCHHFKISKISLSVPAEDKDAKDSKLMYFSV